MGQTFWTILLYNSCVINFLNKCNRKYIKAMSPTQKSFSQINNQQTTSSNVNTKQYDFAYASVHCTCAGNLFDWWSDQSANNVFSTTGLPSWKQSKYIQTINLMYNIGNNRFCFCEWKQCKILKQNINHQCQKNKTCLVPILSSKQKN